ncbi:MAG: outer membrane beta-barrel protein [Paucibacter sp.]|nr:outer membrane beta-barrel protein [Roseateles sp.]
MPHAQRRLFLASACLAVWSSAAPAWAESNPYYYGGSLGINRVSNIYRSVYSPNDDTVATASLLAGINQPIGRQRVYADVNVNTNRYGKNTDLNNVGYTVKGGLDWSTIERLSGSITVDNSQALSTYTERTAEALRKKNTENNTNLSGVVRLGLVTKYSLEAGAGYRTRRFSAEEYAQFEFDQNRFSLGLVYQPSPDLRFGVAGRLTNDKYPAYVRRGFILVNGVPQAVAFPVDAREFERKDIDFTTRWVASGASTLDGRISTGRSKVKQGVANDFSGVTGRITWAWQPSVKWNVTSTVSRDTGLESSFANANTSSEQDRITNGLQLSANYELTGKVFLTGSASTAKSRRINNDVGGSRVDDRDNSFNLGARWQYSRGITLGCQVSKSSRDSSEVIYTFDANSYGCYGQILLY